MKRLISFFTIISLLLLTACGGGASTSTGQEGQTSENETDTESNSSTELEPLTIRLGHVGQEGAAYHYSVEYFSERVSEKTDGKVTVDLYPGGQLGGDRDMAENISNGSLSMGLLTLAVLSNWTPIYSGLTMPFLMKNDRVEYELYSSDLYQVDAFKELEQLNMKGLAYVNTGMHHFGTSTKPLHSLEDLKGVTIRATETEMLMDAYAALGMNPTPMAYSDMYSSLQTGVIDAGALQSATWISDGFVEVISNLTVMNAIAAPAILIMNLEEFNQLPEEYQNAIQEAATETQDYMIEFIGDFNEEHLQQMREMEGLTVIEDFDRTGMDELLQPLVEKYAERDEFVKKTFELIEELNSQY